MHAASRAIAIGLLALALLACPARRTDEPRTSTSSAGSETSPPDPDVDRDRDGRADRDDRCVDEPEDLDGFEDEDGCPDIDSDPQTIVACADADDDGIDDTHDRCPEERETFDAHDDDDGCPDLPDRGALLEVRRVGDTIHVEPPIRFEIDDDEILPASAPSLDALASLLSHQSVIEHVQLRVHTDPPTETRSHEPPTCAPDADRDGVTDASDGCPGDRESFDGVTDDDGCPDDAPRWVVRRGLHLLLGEPPSFETGTATLRARAQPQLEVLAAYLAAHPELRLVEVQGHAADDREAPARPLGQARADTIVQALVAHDVEASRLSARGYGDTLPLDTAPTRAARLANTRIELVVREEQVPCLAAVAEP